MYPHWVGCLLLQVWVFSVRSNYTWICCSAADCPGGWLGARVALMGPRGQCWFTSTGDHSWELCCQASHSTSAMADTSSFLSEIRQSCSKSHWPLPSHLEITCEQKMQLSCLSPVTCVPASAQCPHPACPRTSCVWPDPLCPRQRQLIKHMCWACSSFITPEAVLLWLGPRHEKSELLFQFAMGSLHEIREDSRALWLSISLSQADTTACPLIHPLSSASTFGNSGVFAWPHPIPIHCVKLHLELWKQRWFAALCVHLGRDTRVCPRVWV